MMKYKYVWVLWVLAFAKAVPLTAQNIKKERESSVERNDFPKSSLDWIDKLSNDCKKQKYYKEIDGDKTSYEFKCKCNGQRRSIEFNESGILEDVEITIKKKKINPKIIEKIEAVLEQISEKNRIEKVQLQYLPNTLNVEEFIRKTDLRDYDNLELIVAFKTKRKIYRKELLFSKHGALLKSRDIKRIEYDFLLF
ncbi:MAG: hypothetical protein WBG46_15550 [Nonlabens sp.]